LLYGYQFIGVNPSTGVYAFKDLNSDSLINSKDFNVFGNLEPKFYGAFSNNVRFKNWELELFFEFRKQYGASYLASSITNNPPGTMFNQPVLVINRWQKVGDQTDIQKYTATLGSAAYNAAQTFALTRNSGWYDDASYIRLKNVAVSYTVQNWLSKKIKIETIKVFLQAQNIATITKYKGADPETQSFLVLPPLKTITAGIQIIF
jgi:hypothetical protein